MIKLRLCGEVKELKEMLKHISFDEDVEVLEMTYPYPDREKGKRVRIYFDLELKEAKDNG